MTKGIGKAITQKLISHNYYVYGIYNSDKKSADELANEHKGKFEAHKIDLGNITEVTKFFDILNSKTSHLDVLVNNAAIDLFGFIEDFSAENWQRMLDVNLNSVFWFSKFSIPLLKKGSDPVIVNVSSRIGDLKSVEPEFIPYAVTKAGVTAFSVRLARELKDIRVNVLIPAPTKTALFDEAFTKEDEEDLKKNNMLATPEETANLALELILNSSCDEKVLYDPRLLPK